MSLIEDLVISYRTLAEEGVIDAYGHVSVRSEKNPNRYLMARQLAPEFPTIAEAGVPDYEHGSWVGLLATAKVPQAVITRLNAVAVKAAHAPDVKAALLKDGLEVTGTTSAEYAAIIKIEIAKWIQVAKAAGITAQ